MAVMTPSKLVKKHRAQLIKAEQKLPNSEISSNPSPFIIILNGGYANSETGTTPVQLKTHFGQGNYKVKHILGLSSCFLEFTNASEAHNFLNKFNHSMIVESSKTLYMDFINEIPIPRTPNIFPPGLSLIYDFVSLDQEQEIMELVDNQEWENLNNGRSVQHYGFKFNYKTNACDEGNEKEIPDLFKLKDHDYMNQITVNCYEKGDGIPPHVDTHSPFGPKILSLSLLSTTTMEFTNTTSQFTILLPARSLLIMSGEARYGWKHSIPARTFDVVDGEWIERERRISLTYREVLKEGNCDGCNFEEHCDLMNK